MSKLKETSCSGDVSSTIRVAGTFADSIFATSNVSVTVKFLMEIKVSLGVDARSGVVSNMVESA